MNKGLTLIEILITVGLVLIVAVGGYFFFSGNENIESNIEEKNTTGDDMDTTVEMPKNDSWKEYVDPDGLYRLKYTNNWSIFSDEFYNPALFRIGESEGGIRKLFHIGFVAGDKSEQDSRSLNGRTAKYSSFEACLGEAQTRAGGPECVLTIINITLTPEESVKVQTIKNSDSEVWSMQITYGVTTEELYTTRNQEIFDNLKKTFSENESLFEDTLRTIKFSE